MISKLESKIFGKNNRFQLTTKEKKELKKDFKNSTILITGAAGSIGSIFTKELKNFDFKKIYLLDKDENSLADLARSLNLLFKSKVKKIYFTCCDLNSINLHNFLKEKKISHYFNFAALKHVRSEETYESSIYMFKTNCIYPFNFGDLSKLQHIKKIFFISTDKAVHPLSVMGLTKKIMESNLSIVKNKHPKKFVSSVRFANVSFSNGSLLKNIYEKTLDNIPFGVPINVKRYFIKQKEAANLCMKSLLNKCDGKILIPSYKSVGKAYDLKKISEQIVIELGKKPKFVFKLQKTHKNSQQIILHKKKIMGQKFIKEMYEKNEKIIDFGSSQLLFLSPLKKSFETKLINKKVLNSKNIYELRKILQKISNNENFQIFQNADELNKII